MQEVIPRELIEKALALTGMPIEEVESITGVHWVKQEAIFWFSMETFCYYLLSPEFIEKYKDLVYWDWSWNYNTVCIIWNAVYEYQKWEPESLIFLLEKI